jgi:hypothetical protein
VPLALARLARERLPELARAILRRPGAPPPAVALAALRGRAAGPWAYHEARRGEPPREAPAAA